MLTQPNRDHIFRRLSVLKPKVVSIFSEYFKHPLPFEMGVYEITSNMRNWQYWISVSHLNGKAFTR